MVRPKLRAFAVACLVAGCALATSGRAFAQTIVDAEALGARGDDAIDDTLAIQAAIDAALRTPSARVRLPPGRLLVSDRAPIDAIALRIEHARGLQIVGAGRGTTVLELRSSADAHVVWISSSTDVTIDGLTIDGNRGEHRSGHGIRGADVDGLTIRDVSIRQAAHYGIGLQRGALRRILVERVEIEDTGGDGIDFKNTAGANADIVLRDVAVARHGQELPRQAGIDVRGPAALERVTVRDVPAGGAGIRFRGDGPTTGPGGHGSSLVEFSIIVGHDAVGVAVAANDVRVARGVVEGGWTGVHVIGARVEIERVIVRGAARYGFRVGEAAEHARLDACAAHGARAGVWLEAPEASVRDCVIAGSAECAICVRPSAVGATLESNVTQ